MTKKNVKLVDKKVKKNSVKRIPKPLKKQDESSELDGYVEKPSDVPEIKTGFWESVKLFFCGGYRKPPANVA